MTWCHFIHIILLNFILFTNIFHFLLQKEALLSSYYKQMWVQTFLLFNNIFSRDSTPNRVSSIKNIKNRMFLQNFLKTKKIFKNIVLPIVLMYNWRIKSKKGGRAIWPILNIVSMPLFITNEMKWLQTSPCVLVCF